jgi:hypothetical protein
VAATGCPVSMVLAQTNLKKTLETGVTTVRDMNAAEYTDVAMRDLIRTLAVFGGPSTEDELGTKHQEPRTFCRDHSSLSAIMGSIRVALSAGK